MDSPCKHCDKADMRPGILKCDKPCNRGKDYYECEKLLIQVLQGKVKL